MAHEVAGAGAGPHRAGAAATTRCPGEADARPCAARHRDAVRGVGGRHRQGDRRLLPRHRHEEFLRFLKHVANTYRRRKLHIVVDNYATHKHPDVTSWLDKHKRITLHFTPTSGSWLNMVEIFFGIITRQAIRRGTFTSVKDLIGAIEIFIDAWNERCQPFIWTKTADQIIPHATKRQGQATSIARH